MAIGRRAFSLGAMMSIVGGANAGKGGTRGHTFISVTPAPAPATTTTSTTTTTTTTSTSTTTSTAGSNRVVQMQPMASTSVNETHAVLAVSTAAFGAGGASYSFTGRTRTLQQLRVPTPNAWEVSWVVWNYSDDNHLYYFVLKPNGWEIGKRDPRYYVAGVNDGQKIIATGETAVAPPLGTWYDFDVRVTGQQADIYVNGQFVCHFNDTDTGGFVSGKVGLYAEDALCQWDSVSAPFVDTFDMEPVQPFVDGTQLANWTVVYLGFGSGGIVAV
jgi:hypothetical protein